MRVGAVLVAVFVLPPCAVAAPSTPTPNKDVAVRCDSAETIGRALSKLDKTRPNVLNVYGTCQENVVIAGFEDLKIIGKAGATLLAAPPEATSGIEVTASGRVSIEAFTMRMTGSKVAMQFTACDDCRVKNVAVDGGIAFYAVSNSNVTASRLTVTGNSGGWTAIGAWHSASLSIEDSSFEGGGRWCGLCVGENATAIVYRSAFRDFGVGVSADSGAFAQILEDTTVERNWCWGLGALGGGRLRVTRANPNDTVAARVADNASTCWGGGINVDSTSSVFVDHTEVTGNTGGGIKLNHHAFASLGDGTVVSSNSTGPGLEVRNASMAVAPGRSDPPTTVQVSGNGPDLVCDSISHINNAAQITGATQIQCANLHAADTP